MHGLRCEALSCEHNIGTNCNLNFVRLKSNKEKGGVGMTCREYKRCEEYETLMRALGNNPVLSYEKENK